MAKKKTVYVITMKKYGERNSHSYVLGVWTSKTKADKAGAVEEAWRGGKYKPSRTEWIPDANEYDTV